MKEPKQLVPTPSVRNVLSFRGSFLAKMLRCVLVVFVCLKLADAWAGQFPCDDSALCFFTNVASRLMQAELGMNLRSIQVYPTSEYSAAVHRLLQLSANLCDAAGKGVFTNGMSFPSVFRPLFTKTILSSGPPLIFISGYEEVTNALQVLAPDIHWTDPSSELPEAPMNPRDMVYGIPLIIGARKGFPSFNEFWMETRLQVARKLQFRREESTRLINQTNQMYTLSISNTFGVEAWNSYSNAYPGALQMHVAVDVWGLLTNQFGDGLLTITNCAVRHESVIDAGAWAGYTNPVYAAQPSFRVPVVPDTNVVTILSNSTYSSAAKIFIPESTNFEQSVGREFAAPRWWITLNTRLRFVLIDLSTGRLIDFVNLEEINEPLDITATLMIEGKCSGLDWKALGSMWCTNRPGDTEGDPTFGILNQIASSLGNIEPADWAGPTYTDHRYSIDFFRYQFDFSPKYYPDELLFKTNVFYAAYEPRRTIFFQTKWQANDPLVHYTLPDLTDTLRNFQTNRIRFTTSYAYNLGLINERYEPWGGNPRAGSSRGTAYDPTVKDPMVIRSDDWDFPTNGFGLDSLGRIHRGTPWQTIYLKSGSPQLGTWFKWVGGKNGFQAQLSHPVRDWHLVGLLAPLFSTSSVLKLLSINESSAQAWEQALHGINVCTNYGRNYEWVVMISNSPQAGVIAAGINAARSTASNGRFTEIGQILGVRELSLSSPWLNTNYPGGWSITDRAYEAIPSQLLPLVRPDSIGLAASEATNVQLRFSGWDNAAYFVQASSNLVDWVTMSTNQPVQGLFYYTPPGGTRCATGEFYRTLIAE